MSENDKPENMTPSQWALEQAKRVLEITQRAQKLAGQDEVSEWDSASVRRDVAKFNEQNQQGVTEVRLTGKVRRRPVRQATDINEGQTPQEDREVTTGVEGLLQQRIDHIEGILANPDAAEKLGEIRRRKLTRLRDELLQQENDLRESGAPLARRKVRPVKPATSKPNNITPFKPKRSSTSS